MQEYERLVRRIMPICSRLQGKNVDQTFAILDVKGPALPCCGRVPTCWEPPLWAP